ncbi:hypothetical protein KDW_13230 [Dictyobacter vulcani]|uniref:Uncharacterized protein n=1 Tax=Dictyobacter vulcani TaxID=2607529 RepID=A0A5J4KLP6_9CHLR|nr:hypothetical protein [Dictyobacter vulcani]GER87161.1 hypothetical protein KDW_13230 [Dictyobacter vulcani]
MSTPSDSFSAEDSASERPQPEQDNTPAGDGLELAATPTADAPESPGSQLPPEAQGETNGGPLGCCLGTMVGMLLSLSVAIFGRFYAESLAGLLHSSLSTTIRIVMVIVAIIAVIICGYLGWKIGKRLYREYDPPPIKRRRARARRR